MMFNQDIISAFAEIPEREKNMGLINLSGTWLFKAVDEDRWFESVVPGSVHSDLIRVGRLEDPYYRDNEFKVQWVEKKEWEYKKTFLIESPFLKYDAIMLKCFGLDTVTDIYINDILVGKSQNMFIEYEFDVKPYLKTGENTIHIIFRNILEWNKKQKEMRPQITWNDEKGHYYFTRKCGSDFGWDWGLRLLSCGIWRPVCIYAYSEGRIKNFHLRQNLSDSGKAEMNISADIERYNSHELSLDLKVSLYDKTIIEEILPVTGESVNLKLVIGNPELWWPNGLGSQPLYRITAHLKYKGTIVHTWKTRTGFRKIELVQEKDERGLTFGFKVNGNLIFCKGGNWIPAGNMRGVLTIEHYRHLLQSCKETNFNMIRLWGGGIYEAECFYNYCDENGIMLWHDFMFAVGPYLGDEEFLNNVKDEIADVVKRLRDHPSIILWCGNNEQESSMPKWVLEYETATWKEFDKVFYEAISKSCVKYDPDRLYWPSSPHHPLDREKKTSDYRTASGDAHIWSVWHGEKPISSFGENLDYRFVSEFGLLSLPPMATIDSFTEPEDRCFPSYILDLRNKSGKKSLGTENAGTYRIAKYISESFKMPGSLLGWVYLSQLVHGEALKIAIESYRRNYPNTTGGLYWQINDNWPTVSYSTMDYYGRWKAPQYMAKHFFNPVLVCGQVEESHIRIWGVNDMLYNRNLKMQWSLSRFDGNETKHSEKPVVLPPNGSILIDELDLSTEINENPDFITYRDTNYENRRQYYLSYNLVENGKIISSNVSFFAPYKYLALRQPEIEYETFSENNLLYIILKAKYFAAFVELGVQNEYARFSDNYFHLLPGEARKIELLECDMAVNEVVSKLYITSLSDGDY